MKYSILWICWISPLIAIAQDYQPFPTSNAVWRLQWGASGCAFQNEYADYQYQLNGDTIIEPYVYHKLERIGVFNCQPPLMPLSGYMGAFRNDVDAMRVYFIPADSTAEWLLYDFTLQVGDTINGYLPNVGVSGTNTAVISSIDSVEVSGSYLKRWNYSSSGNYWDGFFIEGIGGEYGPLEALAAQFDFNGSLICFTSYELVYPDGLLNCDLATGGRTHVDKEYSIYPNPVTDQLLIPTSRPAHLLGLWDASGRLYIVPTEADGSMLRIRMDELVTGIYYVSVTNGATLRTFKILKE